MLKPGPRTIAVMLAAALALSSAAAPASARFFDRNNQGSITFPPQPTSQPTVSTPPSHSGGSDWGELAIGSSATALALLAIGGTLASRRPRKRSTASRSARNA
jgi:hypothetical protein